MTLYHGSKEIVEFPEIRIARYNKDFYFGFYCTQMPEQAVRWATRYGTRGYLNKYEYTENSKLKYLVFEKMTEEQKNAVIEKMGDGYKNWQNELERIGTIGIFEKNTSEEKISKITKCDTHTKIGVSSDGKYDCYFSTNSKSEIKLLNEFKKTEIQIIEKKERPKNGFVLSEKTDLENTEAFKK